MLDLIKDKDKELFIKTLNKRGFILEKKVYRILAGMGEVTSIERNKVISTNIDLSSSEIDVILGGMSYFAMIECKRTDYTWFFTKSLVNMLNMISYNPTKNELDFIPREHSITSTDSDIAVMINDTGDLVKQGYYAQTSYEDVFKHSIQLIKNLDSYITVSWKRFFEKAQKLWFIPILLTNAELGIIEFEDSHINDNGDLTDYKEIKKVDYLAYNKSFPMRFDEGNDVKLKSVFIVNIKHLKEFIEKLNRPSPFRDTLFL